MVPDPRYFTPVGLGAVLPFYPPVGHRDAVAPSGVAGLDLAGAAAAEEGVARGGEECDER